MTSARVAAAAVSIAAAVLAAPAAGYVRTADRTTGVELSWPVPVVQYDLSSAPAYACCADVGCDPAGNAGPIEDVVRASFSAWEQGCADLRLVYGGTIPELRTGLAGSAENLVVVRRGFCSQVVPADAPCRTEPDGDCSGIYDCFQDRGPADWSTVALTTVLYDPGTGRVFDADLEVNGWDGVAAPLPSVTTAPQHGYYVTCEKQQPDWPKCSSYGDAGCYAYDLRNTVTHEAGHFIGLAHPCGDPGTPSCALPPPPGEVPYDQRAMYPATEIGDVQKRALSADDVAGVCAIYPPPGGCGCAAGGAPGALAALFAALALRPRLRRRGRPRSRPPAGGRR